MKERLDLIVAEKTGLTRPRARYLIEKGFVNVDGKTIIKPGQKFEDTVTLTITGDDIPYVSRGGLKLEKALKVFPVSVKGKVCMDLGASTGGFTDCMLQNGASFVYAVDSGHGQLHESLCQRNDVANLEGINGKNLTSSLFDQKPEFVSIDVSFISLTKVLSSVYETTSDDAEVICLVKPQFEAGKADLGSHGVVKNPKVHKRVLNEVADYAQSIGFTAISVDYSPVKGPEGNIEYLLYLRKTGERTNLVPIIDRIVEQSHKELSK